MCCLGSPVQRVRIVESDHAAQCPRKSPMYMERKPLIFYGRLYTAVGAFWKMLTVQTSTERTSSTMICLSAVHGTPVRLWLPSTRSAPSFWRTSVLFEVSSVGLSHKMEVPRRKYRTVSIPMYAHSPHMVRRRPCARCSARETQVCFYKRVWMALTHLPGYSITARMIVETALTCALDHDKLHPLGKKGGALTPATIGADAIAERFVKYAGFDISTKDF